MGILGENRGIINRRKFKESGSSYCWARYTNHTEPNFQELSLLKIQDPCVLYGLKVRFKYINDMLLSHFLQYL